jgi:predicted lipoprotein
VAAAAVVVVVLLWFFPLFRVVRFGGETASAATFDPATYAQKFWSERLQPAAKHAAHAPAVLAALQRDPAAAAKSHAHQVGIGGTAYYIVHGTGRVVSADKNQIVVAVDDVEGAQVALRLGPLFGNTVRDGTGLLNVNEFPGLAEFNALSAELNRLVEAQVFPAARKCGVVGTRIVFTGCAEAPEDVGPGPLLALVPLGIEPSK